MSNIQNISLFHITQPKAGSQWIYKILKDCSSNTIVQNESYSSFLEHKIIPGKIYPTLYITKEEFDAAPIPSNSQLLLIVRDLRDLLISLYFSIKYSHPIINEKVVQYRDLMNDLSLEKALVFLINDEVMQLPVNIHASWLKTENKCIKYEELLTNDVDILTPILTPLSQYSQNQIQEIIIKNRFENITNGRQRGEENIHSHERKAIAGDWQNFFSLQVKNEFKKQYGTFLINSKYEENNNW